MRIGFFFAVAACFVWGLIFIVPHFLSDFSPLEVALGRYFAFGLLSLALLLRKGVAQMVRFSRTVWIKALLFGLFSNILYYIGVVLGVRFATPPVTVLILGLTPILVALYGNWYSREWSIKGMLIPFILLGIGMVLVNLSAFTPLSFSSEHIGKYLGGLLGALVALLGWTWFAVENARFLKKSPEIPGGTWATFLGATTFLWVVVLLPILHYFELIACQKFIEFNPATVRFFAWILVLGVVCSWIGCFLWNRASIYLPLSMIGFFIIFETLFGLLFVYLVEARLPSFLEFLGIFLMVGGILMSLRSFRLSKKREAVIH